MSSPYQLSSTHPVCGYQKGTPLAIGTPHLAVLRFIVRAAPLFMLLDSPGDTGGPRRYRGDNSPSDLVSQTISQGWPRGWLDVCVVTTSYQPQPAFSIYISALHQFPTAL